MSWGTSFKADIFISRENFNSKYEVEDKITECNDFIAEDTRKLAMLSVSSPRDVMPNDEDSSPIYYMNNMVSELVSDIEDCSVKKYMYQLLLENWDEKKE